MVYGIIAKGLHSSGKKYQTEHCHQLFFFSVSYIFYNGTVVQVGLGIFFFKDRYVHF